MEKVGNEKKTSFKDPEERKQSLKRKGSSHRGSVNKRGSWLNKKFREDYRPLKSLASYFGIPLGEERLYLKKKFGYEKLKASQIMDDIITKRPWDHVGILMDYKGEMNDIEERILDSIENLKKFTRSKEAILYMASPDLRTIYEYQEHHVRNTNIRSLNIESGTTISGHVACTKSHVVTDDICLDQRFTEGLGSGEKVRFAAMAFPILGENGQIHGVVEFSKDKRNEPYERNEISIAACTIKWMGLVISFTTNNIFLKKDIQIKEYLLDFWNSIRDKDIPLPMLMSELQSFAKDCIGSVKSSFHLLIDDEYVAYEEAKTVDGKLSYQKKKVELEVENNPILSKVIECKKIVSNNFGPQSDENNDKFTPVNSFLAAPIFCGGNRVIGVLEFLNKIEDGNFFTEKDRKIVENFCIFGAGLICQSSLSKGLQRKFAGLDENKTFIKYLMKSKKVDTIMETNTKGQSINSTDILRYDWYPLERERLLDQANYILKRGIGHLFNNDEQIFKFIALVMQAHDDFIGVNFEHSLNTVHCVTMILENNTLYFSDLERDLLIIAAFIHAIFSLGIRTNQFEHSLKEIYGSDPKKYISYLFEACEIFTVKDKYNFGDILEEVKNLIYYCYRSFNVEERNNFLEILKSNQFDCNDTNHRDFVKMIILVVADVSHHCKPFKIVEKLVKLRFKENFCLLNDQKQQSRHYKKYLEGGDKFIAEYEVEFLKVICLPWLYLLNCFFSDTEELTAITKRTMSIWVDYLARNEKLWWPIYPLL